MAGLTLSQLTIGYRNKTREERLFENLNLHLAPGQLVCFMGPNGIGKSTLLRTLAGLHSPLSGTMTSVTPAEVAIVLTEKIQTPHLTVRELIALGRYPYLEWHVTLRETDQAIVEKCLRQVRMEKLADKKLLELSDGQLQMALIGRALAQTTPVLLLDEPTAHLDLNNRVEIMNLLRHLAREEQKAILVATHELDLALQTADRIWLALGKNIVQGIPEDLVLNGAFDDVFQLKGFDLKTGKVQHEPYRQRTIQLQGEGYHYLWTKNALEREGFEVTSHAREIVSIDDSGWNYQGKTYRNLEMLIQSLS
jgi:iron complex transport system ATP-binding protein